jgi:hypothetical protein
MPKGGKRPGAGRPKGSPNKLHAATKETVKAFVDEKAHRIGELWDDVAEVDKAKAIALWGQIAEYVLPKLGRLEHSGEDGGPVKVSLKIDLGGA